MRVGFLVNDMGGQYGRDAESLILHLQQSHAVFAQARLFDEKTYQIFHDDVEVALFEVKRIGDFLIFECFAEASNQVDLCFVIGSLCPAM